MKKLLVLLLLLTLVVGKTNAQDSLKTPNSEVEDALTFLSQVDVLRRPYIRFFSTYALPENLRQDAALILSFACHSLIGPGNENYFAGGYYPIAKMDGDIFVPIQNVPESDTLWWIDIRDYGWTPESWEKVSLLDGYFVEPIVRSQNNLLLNSLAGNAVVRADWFIDHALNTTQQQDLDVSYTIYEELLFASTKNKPKTAQEWRTLWGFSQERAKTIGNEIATLVTKSKAVAKHNRFLFMYRTEIGYWCETYDAKNHIGFRNYAETYLSHQNVGGPPDISDGGEIFGTNAVGMQVYALRDGQNNLVNFGDPTLVRHISDIYGDVRVRVADSCIDCHASGPLEAENTINEFLDAGASALIKDYNKYQRFKRNFVSQDFNEKVKEYKDYYAQAMLNVNGLTPEKNGELYVKVVTWYREAITLRQACLECGIDEATFIEAVNNKKYGTRNKLLIATGEAIPRDIWESRSVDGIPGSFQLAMMAIYDIAAVENYPAIESPNEQQDSNTYIARYKSKIDVDIKTGQTVVGKLFAGDIIESTEPPKEFDGKQWIKIITEDGNSGFVKLDVLEKLND